jgi:hypothetical protein
VKYVLNIKTFTILCILVLFLIIKSEILTNDIINEFINKNFSLNDIKNLSIANIGIFASLTGFLIAAIPFLVSIIVKADYLINAVNNNLKVITFTLKIIFFLFIYSLIILFIDISFLSLNAKTILIFIYIYFYLILLYYIYEIIGILHVFVSDLKELKKNIDK